MIGRRILAVLGLSGRRIRSSLGLFVAGVIASAALVSIWVGIPLYAESATAALLNNQLDDAEVDSVPFGYLFSFNRLSGGNQPAAALAPVNEYLAIGETPFGSSVRSTRRFVETIPFDVYLDGSSNDERLDRIGFSSLDVIDGNIEMISGRPPESTADGNVEVMASEALAEDLGLSVGQILRVESTRSGQPQRPSVAVQITGIWTLGTDAGSRAEARFARSGAMRQSFVLPEAMLGAAFADLDDSVISNAQWLVLLDAATVTTDNVDELLARTDDINRAVDSRLAGTRLLVSPESSLLGFQENVARLQNGLAAFSIPTLALVVFVAGLIAAMSWAGRAAEVDLLRRRGVSCTVLVGGAIAEAAAITAVAVLVGGLLSFGVAELMARTSTFLQLGESVELQLAVTSRARRAVAVVAVIVLVLHVLPSLSVYRWSARTAVRRSETRSQSPWWQRSYLDLTIIIGTAAFAWFVLQSESLRQDLLDDPVVILLPAALSVSVGLVVLRVLPPALGWLSRLVERTNSTSLLLVLRRAARSPGPLAAPLMLLIVTGALSVYSASLARTLDLQLLDQAYHEVGGSNSIADDLSSTGDIFVFDDGRPAIARGASGPPVSESAYERVWGLDAVTRLAQVPGRAEGIGGGEQIPIELTAIDPSSFGGAAFWRDDYSTEPLSTLLAALESTPDGVIVHRRVLRSGQLRVGDVIDISASVGDRSVDVPMVIVGSFEQFPTWSPANPLAPAVVSLSDLEARLGTSVARRVIFTRSEGVIDDAQTRADLNRLGIGGARVDSAADRINDAQARPERQGIFGLLTVSFVLSTALTLAAFVFYASFGFRQQLTEVGVLRAVGLRLRSLFVLVGSDLLLVATVGTGAAVLSGVVMARGLLPRLIGTPSGSAPVLLPEVDWSATAIICGGLVIAFLAVTALLLIGLRQIRLFEAVKLGATS